MSGTAPFNTQYSYLENGRIALADAHQPADLYDCWRYREHYTYDALGRLIDSDHDRYGDGDSCDLTREAEPHSSDGGSSGWIGTRSFDVRTISYDKNGNITFLIRRDKFGFIDDDVTYVYGTNDDTNASPNRLKEITDEAVHDNANWDLASGTFSYDAVGNLTSMTVAPYALSSAEYDERNLSTSITTGGTTTTYRYSIEGQRTYKQNGTSDPEYYVLDGRTTLAVVTGSSLDYWNVTLPSGEVIGRHLNSGGRRYYLKDHLGSVRVVVDGSGTVKETRDYYPFGLPMPGRITTEATPAKEDFTGHERDTETGLHYAGARYYMSALGRWTTTDPILQEQGPKTLLGNGRGSLLATSPYNYSLNNPTNLRDPDGRAPMDDYYIKSDGSARVHRSDGPNTYYLWTETDGSDGRYERLNLDEVREQNDFVEAVSKNTALRRDIWTSETSNVGHTTENIGALLTRAGSQEAWDHPVTQALAEAASLVPVGAAFTAPKKVYNAIKALKSSKYVRSQRLISNVLEPNVALRRFRKQFDDALDYAIDKFVRPSRGSTLFRKLKDRTYKYPRSWNE